MKKCPNCGYVMENDRAKFCRKCGTRQPDQINVSDNSPATPITDESPSVPIMEDNKHNDGIFLGEFRKESPNDEGVQIFLGENQQEEDAISPIPPRETAEESASTQQSVSFVAPQPQQDSFYLWAKIIIIFAVLCIIGALSKSFAGNRVDMIAASVDESTGETLYVDGVLSENGVQYIIIPVELSCGACGVSGD